MPLNGKLKIKFLTIFVFIAIFCCYNLVRFPGKKIVERESPQTSPQTLSYIAPGRTRFLLDDDTDNCSKPDKHRGFSDSCSFVLATCESEAGLFDYMQFVFCDLGDIKPLAYVIMGLWLLLLISLLATTVSNSLLLNKRLNLCMDLQKLFYRTCRRIISLSRLCIFLRRNYTCHQVLQE